MLLRKARENELGSVLKLYRAAIGTEGCTWTEDYPDEQELSCDFGADCLYVLTNDDVVIGAVSVVPENELDDLDCWRIKSGAHREIARIVVSADNRGKGCARAMLTQLFSVLSRQSCDSVRLLVARDNKAAIKLYKALGFSFIGECHRYGHHFYICEKALEHLDNTQIKERK